jgi:hypothetical protein
MVSDCLENLCNLAVIVIRTLQRLNGVTTKMTSTGMYLESLNFVPSMKALKSGIAGGVAGLAGVLTAGVGNYTAQYTPVTSSVALGNLADYIAFCMDVMTACGNWIVTNPPGEIYIAMSLVVFGLIMIKSFFRRGSGRRR